MEIREAVNETKSGKVPGLYGFPLECLKKDGLAVLECLDRLLNVSLIWGFYLWTVCCMYACCVLHVCNLSPLVTNLNVATQETLVC